MTVFVRLPNRSTWCDLRAAFPGGRITTACSDWMGYAMAPIATVIPDDMQCPACRRARGAEVVPRAQRETRDLSPTASVDAADLPIVVETIE